MNKERSTDVDRSKHTQVAHHKNSSCVGEGGANASMTKSAHTVEDGGGGVVRSPEQCAAVPNTVVGSPCKSSKGRTFVCLEDVVSVDCC